MGAADKESGEDATRTFFAKDTFEEDTALKTGQSKRLVQLNAERGEKIDDEVLANITGTHLDCGTALTLAHCDPRKLDLYRRLRAGKLASVCLL